MTKQFGKSTNHTVEMSHVQSDGNAQKYRFLCVHIHIVALACAMVGFCFHTIMTYEDVKKQRYYRLARHIPCAILFVMVIIGNRLYKPILYLAYLVLDFIFVLLIIVVEIVRQYRIRSDPELQGHIKHSILFFVAIWAIVLIVEILIYFIIYKDYKFVREFQENQPTIQTIRQMDRTVPAGRT